VKYCHFLSSRSSPRNPSFPCVTIMKYINFLVLTLTFIVPFKEWFETFHNRTGTKGR
jgi:hypothetical protein